MFVCIKSRKKHECCFMSKCLYTCLLLHLNLIATRGRGSNAIRLQSSKICMHYMKISLAHTISKNKSLRAFLCFVCIKCGRMEISRGKEQYLNRKQGRPFLSIAYFPKPQQRILYCPDFRSSIWYPSLDQKNRLPEKFKWFLLERRKITSTPTDQFIHVP